MSKNYKELGLKTGLEFHQRLDTHKLFCNCPSIVSSKTKPDYIIHRKMRPVAGELGDVDAAAMLEFVKDKTFEYWGYDESTCLIDCDCQPPNPLNQESLDIALEIALLLDCKIVDELHMMRKTVIDGSNTSGFQRTAMLASDGTLKTKFGDVKIGGLFLEEEAAGIVEEKKGTKTYRIDRLGIPLVEIATGIMQFSPEEVQETALALGTLLRVTGKVQRGLGTIRQDVNISIKGGERIEVKGLQDIRMLAKTIELEVQRQQSLIRLKEMMEERKLKKSRPELQSFSAYFKSTKCKFIADALKKGQKIHGIVLPDFKGLLGFELTPGRRFGTELAGIAKSFGFAGLIHSDEDLAKYNIEKDAEAMRKDLSIKENDAFLFIAGEPAVIDKTLEMIVERINHALSGVPRETRKPLPDGNTDYMRSIAGAHRMYPETDIPPVLIDEERIEKIKKNLPDSPEKIVKKLVSKYKLGEELADKLVTSPRLGLFYEICDNLKVPAKTVAGTLEETLVELRRAGSNVEALDNHHFIELFTALEQGQIAKEAVPKILAEWSKNPQEKFDFIAKSFSSVSEKELAAAVSQLAKQHAAVIKDDKRRAFNILMGDMMKQFRGRADGALISKVVKNVTEK
ncbi:MAG: Glu-tRNA(Gln) amidotransferase subunit GatE [Candidatus Micrarchaeota archaeon]